MKNSKLLTDKILEKDSIEESNLYKLQLVKLKEFLQEKMDKYPEIAKDIANDMNIISKEIGRVDSIPLQSRASEMNEKSSAKLDVADDDMYQDANTSRDIEAQEEEEQERPRGFRR